jgi:hypothetical protein
VVGGASPVDASAGVATDGGDIGSISRAGGSRGGEAGSTPGGVGGGTTDGSDTGSVCRVGKSGGGEDGGGTLNGGMVGQVGGERSNSQSVSETHNSSTLFRRFLVRFACGGAISGGEGGEGARLGGDKGPLAGAAATGMVDWAGTLPTAVAARLSLRQRR